MTMSRQSCAQRQHTARKSSDGDVADGPGDIDGVLSFMKMMSES